MSAPTKGSGKTSIDTDEAHTSGRVEPPILDNTKTIKDMAMERSLTLTGAHTMVHGEMIRGTEKERLHDVMGPRLKEPSKTTPCKGKGHTPGRAGQATRARGSTTMQRLQRTLWGL